MLHGACRENEELIDLNLQLRVMDKNARCMCGLMPIKRVSEPVKEGEIDITLHETKNNKLGRAESEMDCDIEVTQRAKKSLNTEDRKVKKRKRGGQTPGHRNASEPNTTQSHQFASYERSKLMQLPTDKL